MTNSTKQRIARLRTMSSLFEQCQSMRASQKTVSTWNRLLFDYVPASYFNKEFVDTYSTAISAVVEQYISNELANIGETLKKEFADQDAVEAMKNGSSTS